MSTEIVDGKQGYMSRQRGMEQLCHVCPLDLKHLMAYQGCGKVVPIHRSYPQVLQYGSWLFNTSTAEMPLYWDFSNRVDQQALPLPTSWLTSTLCELAQIFSKASKHPGLGSASRKDINILKGGMFKTLRAIGEYNGSVLLLIMFELNCWHFITS